MPGTRLSPRPTTARFFCVCCRRLIRRYFLERQRAKPQLYERAGAKLVVDAGCNHGTYSLFAAAHGYRVLCFEINPELSKLVEQSKALNPATGYLISVQVPALLMQRPARVVQEVPLPLPHPHLSDGGEGRTAILE